MRSRSPAPVPGRFDGATVLVTGGASGIGSAAVRRFAQEGASVLAADLDAAAAEAAHDGRERVTAHPLDQTDEQSVAALFEQVAARGGADVVCVNAGIAVPERTLEQTDAATWSSLHDVNLRGAFLVARAALPALRQRGGGALLFTASTSGLVAHPGAAAYAASKGGLLSLSRSLALEVASDGIRVNCVCPGGVRTPMIGGVYGDAAEALAAAARSIPLGRVAEADDVAAALAFLASDDARHITAAELVVDGGRSACP